MFKAMVILGMMLVLCPVILLLTPFIVLGSVLVGVFVLGGLGLGLLIALVKVIGIFAGLAIGGIVLVFVALPITILAIIF